MALIKGATLDPKIGLYFTHRNGLLFGVKADLSGVRYIVVRQLQ